MNLISAKRGATIALGILLLGATGRCFGGDTPPRTDRIQGWTAQQRSDWYGGKQGSRLMPYAWFKALEQPAAAAPFADPAHMATFRFLDRPDQPLPVGFAVDDNKDDAMTYSRLRWFAGQGNGEPWVGLNCAACHTGEIAVAGKPPLRIDGAPGLVDFQRFIEALDRALAATHDDPAKWNRFVTAVLGARDDAPNRILLKTEFGRLIAWQQGVARLDATPLRYGYGRLDAVGRIFNKVALFARPEGAMVNVPDAPVSYPFLWDIWRQDRLQYNGIARSARLKLGGGRFFDYGAMGRNAGEVIGVFGDVDTTPGPRLAGLRSSIWADNLDRLEVQLQALQAPVWPVDYFPALSPAEQQVARSRRKAGEALFAARGCVDCHAPVPAGISQYKVTMVPLTSPERTDIWMACNAFTYNALSGKLAGVAEDFVKGRALGPLEPSGTLLATTVKGTLVGKKRQLVRQIAGGFVGVRRAPVALPQDESPEGRLAARAQRCITEPNELLAYKARPLDGIWATAPYLHNGSVPTLYDLLLAPKDRPKVFHTGTHRYDPVRAGYDVRPEAPGNGFRFDTALRGNSNEGHDYGVGTLEPEERLALLEYLKAL